METSASFMEPVRPSLPNVKHLGAQSRHRDRNGEVESPESE